MRLRIVLIGLLLLLVTLIVAGLVLMARAPSSSTKLRVVAAENFYGDIVRQIGGSHVAVTSILSDPNADPHLFEPGTANGLAVSTAALVIQNGLGYDAFIQRLESAAPSSHRVVVTISDVLGFRGAETNPHIWYDVPKLPLIAGAIASGLERADPSHRAVYESGLRRFLASLAPLQREVAAIRASFSGQPIAYTEPVPGYLIEAAGLRNLAPSSFTRAIESGNSPTPQDFATMARLVTERQVRVLLYNTQAVSPVTSDIRSAAERAGIPVLGVTETLPPGSTFQAWLLAETRALHRALVR
jgi:zinc/manganese transport system substrate-binding protein